MNVIMIGKPDLQTDHLLSLVRDSLSIDCRLHSQRSIPADSIADALYVLDMAVLEPLACAEVLSSLNSHGKLRAALFNVDPRTNQTELAALPGVYGLFAMNTSAEDFIRGIKAILAGEYWLPRQVLCEHLEQTRHAFHPHASDHAAKLSPKERQLLALLTQGCSNDNIAHHLDISPHTVKTHFYNLYRKLQVHNRVQAATWAQQHRDVMTERV